MATFFGPGGFGQGPFDEYLARFFGPGAGAGAARRVDITELMTQKTQELLAGAADYARGLGHDDLDALHVLWAATKEATTREMLEGVQVDPDTFAETVQRQ